MEPPQPPSWSFPAAPGKAPRPLGAGIPLWPMVAAVRAVERSVGAHAARLRSLERRAGSAEEKYRECRKTLVEFGSQLESKLAVLGTLVQGYGLLQQRLENMENLLKNKHFWILQLPPGGEVPKVQVMFDSGTADVSAPEREDLEEWQREPRKNVLRGENEPLVSLVPAEEVMTFKVEQLDSEECPQSSEPPTTLCGEPEELLFRGPGPYGSPAQGHQSMSRLVPSAPGEEGLGGNNAVTFYGQNCPSRRPRSCATCGKGCCLREMLAAHQESHGAQCGSEHAGDEGLLHQQHPWSHGVERTYGEERTCVEERSCVAMERFRQSQNAKAHTGIPAVDKVYINPSFSDKFELHIQFLATKCFCGEAAWRRQLQFLLQSLKSDLVCEDSIIHIKQEEELCAADEQEEEAGEAPGEPCPGFQTYATDALSWIKQEEEPRCPERRRSEEEETSTHSSTAHDENAKRDPPSDCFESTACDSGVPARPAEKFSKDAVPGVTWDAPCNSEIMETNPMGNGLGGDARSDRGFAEHFDFFSAQENSVGKRPCERNPSQQEHLQGAREEEKSLSERMFHLLHSCASGERGAGQGAAAAPCEGPPERRLDPADGAGLGDRGGLAGEEQPPAQGEETFPAENPPGSPCWEPRPDKPGPWGRCRQHSGGSAANQQPGQGRGKSYICSDCGKSFICHSWLVRHQMTHTGERPYKCSECDKSYRRKDYLLNHQRQHSGERLFQCPLCRKRFVRRRSFMKHQESHVQETHLTLGGWPCAELRGSVMHSI
ncbi:zinc finger protein 777-like [Columba livia]|nr:zinc finger protein 777-like [Columba livia]